MGRKSSTSQILFLALTGLSVTGCLISLLLGLLIQWPIILLTSVMLILSAGVIDGSGRGPRR